jgi:hypothetical protein
MKSCALFLSLLLTLAGSPAWAEDKIVTGPDRRHEIDLRIEALDAKRAEISTTGPITATVIGLVVTVAGGATFGASGSKCRNWKFGCEEAKSEANSAIAGFALLIAGGATALTGGIIWGVRANRRNKIDAERELLIKERDGLPATLSRIDLRSPYRNGTQFVTLGVRF